MKTKDNYIYILLTRTTTVPSRMIGLLTGATYTHAMLSLDEDFEDAYSFARIHPRFFIPGGMIKENLRRGFYTGRTDPPCRLLRLRVHEEEYRAIRLRVHSMFRNRELYGYNYLGVAANYFGRHHRSDHRYFCSEFVADMVALGSPESGIDPGRTRPSDFAEMPELECIYEGTIGGLCRRIDCRGGHYPGAAVAI